MAHARRRAARYSHARGASGLPDVPPHTDGDPTRNEHQTGRRGRHRGPPPCWLWRLSAAAEGGADAQRSDRRAGRPLAACARRYRYGERQLLVGTMSKASWDPAGLRARRCWTAMNPVCRRSRAGSAAMAQTGAAGGGQGKAGAPDPAVSAFAASGRAAWSIAATAPGFHAAPRSPPTPAPALGTPQGRTLFLVTEALHRSGPDQPQAAGGVFRSEDQGLRWSTMPRSRWARPNARAVLRDARGGAGTTRGRRAAALYRGWRAALAGGDHHGAGVAGCRRSRQRPSTRRPKATRTGAG